MTSDNPTLSPLFRSWRPRLAALAGALSLVILPAHALGAGDTAPDFALDGTNGPVRLSDYRGKTVYLDFWASWCGPCRQSFPWMNEMQTRYQAKGLRVVGVNVDQNAKDAEGFLRTLPARFDVAYDAAGKTPRQYGIKGMPTSLLIGPDGKVLAVHSGFRAEQGTELEQKIKQALKEPS